MVTNDLSVDKGFIPIPKTRSLRAEGRQAVAMSARILETTEVQPLPLAFAFRAKALTTEDVQRSLASPLVKQVFCSSFRADRNFDDNVRELQLPFSSAALGHATTTRAREEVLEQLAEETERARVFIAQANVARAHKRRQHDEDNPTLAQGLRDDPDNWRRAVDNEFTGLQDNGVGEPVSESDVPKEQQILNMMVILKIKRDPAGQYLKHKARAVVLGNQERRSV